MTCTITQQQCDDLVALAAAMYDGMSDIERGAFTPARLRTLHPGVDYSPVIPQFSVFVLRDCRQNAFADGQAAIDACIAA